MAVIAAEGYSTEAIRTLLSRADKQRRYKILVFNDADPFGYNIARTISEATVRMPDYSVEIISLGLFLQEALDMGLQVETFTRKRALPQGLRLTDLEKKYFEGELIDDGWKRLDGKKRNPQWRCRRVEINAIPVRERAPYLERQLQRHGITEKVIPPEEVLRSELNEAVEAKARSVALRQLESAIQREANKLAAVARGDQQNLAEQVRAAFAKHPAQSWRDAIDELASSLLRGRQPNKKRRG
jgi:hypothetical protein